MVCQTADEAINNANRFTRCSQGQCLRYTRTWLEIASRDFSAKAAWDNADHKHKDDRDPPRGAPVFWSGGSRGYGHIGLSLANTEEGVQRFRGTDMPNGGVVTSQDLYWVELNWGMKYLGWTEDLNGILIPYLGKDQGSQWDHGDVYVKKLHQGQKDSDSVARLCYRLRHHPDIPGSHQPPGQTRAYGKEIMEGVRYWQKNIWNDGGPSDGSEMSNPQANKIFGPNYNVIEK